MSIGGLASTLGLPIYHFLLYPVFYNYIPSVLRWIGLGLFLIMFSLLSSSIIKLSRTFTLLSATCMLVNTNFTDNPIYNNWLVLGPVVLYCVSCVIVFYISAEFLFSQSPFQIKGLAMCLMLGLISIFTLIAFFVGELFNHIQLMRSLDVYFTTI